jgi:hypothetical protein
MNKTLQKMSTPAMAFGVGLRNIVVTLWLIWIATFIISRMCLFHEAYVSESNKRVDERWLLEQCKDPEFYSNIRQHTDLCTEVANNAGSSLLLAALSKVASQTHACGGSSCIELVYLTLSRLGWQMGLLLLVLMVVAPNFVYMLLLQVHRRRVQKWSSSSSSQPIDYNKNSLFVSSSFEEDENGCEQQTGALRLRKMEKTRVLPKRNEETNTIKLV